MSSARDYQLVVSFTGFPFPTSKEYCSVWYYLVLNSMSVTTGVHQIAIEFSRGNFANLSKQKVADLSN